MALSTLIRSCQSVNLLTLFMSRQSSKQVTSTCAHTDKCTPFNQQKGENTEMINCSSKYKILFTGIFAEKM